MGIDLNDLSYEQLLLLRHKIDSRIKQLEETTETKNYGSFKQGDRVSFYHRAYGRVSGTLVEMREKTVTVVSDTGQAWDISPHLMRKAITGGKTKKAEIRPFKKAGQKKEEGDS